MSLALLISLTVAIVTLYLGYLSSVFSVSVFINPDQLDDVAPKTGQSTRKFLKRMAEHPATFLQVATFYRWLAFLMMVAVAFMASADIATGLGISRDLAFFISLFAAALVSFTALEALPRRHSLQQVDRRLLRLIPIMRLAFVFSRWYVALQRKVAVRPGESLSEDVKEEIVERAIESLADQVGAPENLVEESERQMIESIFHLDNTEAAEIMSPRVDLVALRLDVTLAELRRIVGEHGHSRYPVYDETVDSIKGILYIKDIFMSPPVDQQKFDAAKYMREPYFVPQDIKIDDLLTTFKERKVHLAVVIDEFGGTAGVVTLEDILEVIVGDIQDEHDEEEAEFIDRGDGVYEVDGGFPLSEFSERLGIPRGNEAFETVAGVVYDICGSVPDEGSELRWGDVTFTVTRLSGQRIERLKAVYRPG
ncbi:MAG: HlyC/CorC family transporter [candidate division Zixibacteria bacterium]|nr:HlyC/CorC family transporter [candidate division Zixibacteria bacterium]